MSAILLKNIICNGVKSDIHIDGQHIRKIIPAGSIGEEHAIASGVEVVDCTGKTALPGFVNMHTHAGMALMRGIGEDIAFSDWIDRIWKVESKIDEEFIYWSTKAACVEMIRTGTTTFNDQYWHSYAAKKAAAEMGIRAAISYVTLDHNDKEEAERQKDQCMKFFESYLGRHDNSLFLMSIHAVYSTSEELMLWAKEFAEKNHLKIHIHVSETQKEIEDCKAQHGGLSPVEYLDRLGILGPDTIAAHTLWLSENDVKILGERKVNCVHNINSNAKLSSGYKFLYNELRDAGANVCIGTDGCASSNNLDMLEAMKTSALFQKAWRNDPKALPTDELIKLATANGADALGIPAGRLEEGKLADISIVNTENTFFLSPGGFLPNLIYSAHSDCIESLIADGRFVMRGRKIKDEAAILANAKEQIAKIN